MKEELKDAKKVGGVMSKKKDLSQSVFSVPAAVGATVKTTMGITVCALNTVNCGAAMLAKLNDTRYFERFRFHSHRGFSDKLNIQLYIFMVFTLKKVFLG